MEEIVSLYVSVPVASFRVARAREYFETYPCPPPSTIYGMLLSLIGETNRHNHEGAEIAVALMSQPEWSVILRTLWRVKSNKIPPGIGENKRPDYQELLTGLKLAVWVKMGKEQTDISLAEKVLTVLGKPQDTNRFGGLSLGESTHLVDELRLLRQSDGVEGHFLVADESGNLALPIWPDHVGSFTRWGQYRLIKGSMGEGLPENAWTVIKRPELVS